MLKHSIYNLIMILIVDNYDSFVYNIVHYLNLPIEEFIILRNDHININKIASNRIDGIIISPGPMGPEEAGISNEIINRYYKSKPILGICLGHQCLGSVFGCVIGQCQNVIHGERSVIKLGDSPLFNGLDNEILAARYHSLYIKEANFNNSELRVIATLKDGTIMGIQHKIFPVFGLQFHPESILTNENGKKILGNFLKIVYGEVT